MATRVETILIESGFGPAVIAGLQGSTDVRRAREVWAELRESVGYRKASAALLTSGASQQKLSKNSLPSFCASSTTGVISLEYSPTHQAAGSLTTGGMITVVQLLSTSFPSGPKVSSTVMKVPPPTLECVVDSHLTTVVPAVPGALRVGLPKRATAFWTVEVPTLSCSVVLQSMGLTHPAKARQQMTGTALD